MATVLLGMPGFNEFKANPSRNHKTETLGEVEQTFGSERNAVVGTDVLRQPSSLKGCSRAVKAGFSAFDSVASHTSR
jgi:hypothetical protein